MEFKVILSLLFPLCPQPWYPWLLRAGAGSSVAEIPLPGRAQYLVHRADWVHLVPWFTTQRYSAEGVGRGRHPHSHRGSIPEMLTTYKALRPEEVSAQGGGEVLFLYLYTKCCVYANSPAGAEVPPHGTNERMNNSNLLSKS